MTSLILNFRTNAFRAALFAVVLLGSCKKEVQQPESIWTLGAESFHTNQVEGGIDSKSGTVLEWRTGGDYARYISRSSSLPAEGTYTIATIGTDPYNSHLQLRFAKGTEAYGCAEQQQATVSRSGNAFRLTLDSVRYYNYANPSKIVMVSAVLRYKEEK